MSLESESPVIVCIDLIVYELAIFSYRGEDFLDGEHVEGVVPEDAAELVLVVFGGVLLFQEVVDEHEFESPVTLLREIFPLHLTEPLGLLVLFDNMAELKGFEYALIKRVEKPQEHV